MLSVSPLLLAFQLTISVNTDKNNFDLITGVYI